MKKLLLLFAAVFALAMGAAAQSHTVSGTVLSAEDGEPLVGATVTPVGGGQPTATDIDGHFTVTVPAGVKDLKVTYIGMDPQTLAASNGMVVKLVNTATRLDEVMVVAYGTAKKSAFTGSASVVGSEELSKRVTTNVADALVGTVPGLQLRGGSGQPGSDAGSINIRGISSMYANTDPLVIVDGSPYPGNLSNIPSNDIESITVLKDAASAALYGARGASGVIIVTTKKGSTSDARVTVDMKWGANTRAVPRYDVIDSPGEYYESYYNLAYNYQRYALGLGHADAYLAANKQTLNDLVYNVYTVPEGQMLIGQNGRLNPNAVLGNRVTRRGEEFYLYPDDWYDLSYRTGFRQEYNGTINGSFDKGNYYASLGYLDEEGVIPESDYERITARFKADYQAKKWLSLGVNVGYVHSLTHQNPNLSDEDMTNQNLAYYADHIAPIYPAFVRKIGADGQPYVATDAEGHVAYDFGTPNSGYFYNRPFLANGNPIGSNLYNKVTTIFNQFNGTFNADFNIFPWLKANVTSNINWGESEFSDYENPWYGSKASVNGYLGKSTTTQVRTNNVQTLTYLKDFGKHHVNVLLGHEYYRSQTRYLEAFGQGGFSPDIPELNAFAYNYDNGSYKSTYNVEGWFGRAQYDFDEKYYANVSYRRDGSSRFAKKHRWGNFWSVGAAWIINKDFLADKEWINLLKLKASVGSQGNDNIGDFGYTDTYRLAALNQKTMGASFRSYGTEDITWETTTNWNVGLEFGFFNNRLKGTLDYYYKKTTDLLFWLNIPQSMGAVGYYDNIGDIRNMGVEFVLSGDIIRTRDIDWNLSFNLSHNSSKILKLPESKMREGGFETAGKGGDLIPFWYTEGGSLYDAYLPSYAGVNEKGEALYYTDSSLPGGQSTQKGVATKKDGVTTNYQDASVYTSGSTLPKVYGGFSTSFRWKYIDCSLSFDYSIGGKVYDYQYAMYMTPPENASGAGSNFHKDWVKSWSPENPTSDIPRWQMGDRYTTAKSDRFLTSASYLNFQSFTLGYTLPKFCKEISNLRVYVMGENLCFWSARKGLDPRFAYYGNQGMTAYSPSRNISGGVQVTF